MKGKNFLWLPELVIDTPWISELKASWRYITEEFWFAHEKYLYEEGRENLVKFFHWSPELMWSYVKGPRICKYLKDPRSLNLNDFKWQIYNDFYPCQERKKYRGYEKVLDTHQKYFQLLSKDYNFKNEVFQTDVESLLKSLCPQELALTSSFNV